MGDARNSGGVGKPRLHSGSRRRLEEGKMCYTGTCEYESSEYNFGCRCRKPRGLPCPDVIVEDDEEEQEDDEEESS